MSACPGAYRLELFCKSPQHLQEHLVPFLQSHKIVAVNLPNKVKGELPQLLERAHVLLAELPEANLCVHYSINANYRGSSEASFKQLEDYWIQLAGLQPRCCSLLLVSGGGQRRKLDSLAALQQAAASQQLRQLRLPLAIAFNPYFPDPQRRQEERERLRLKLQACCSMHLEAVYLQAGADVQLLKEGLQYLQQLLADFQQQQQQQVEQQHVDAHTEKQQQQQQQQPLGETSSSSPCAQSSTGNPDQLQQQPATASHQPEAKRRRKQTIAGLDADIDSDSSKLSVAHVGGSSGSAPPCRGSRQQEAASSATVQAPTTGEAAGGSGKGAAAPAPGPAAAVRVYGSILLPSRKLLAQMRFRPWGGVFLSEQWLGSVEGAEAATQQVLQVYAEHGVTPIIETEVETEDELVRMQHIMCCSAAL